MSRDWRRVAESAPGAAQEARFAADNAAAESSNADAPAADADALEAPALAEMVANGELPPLAERLPAEPLVVDPVESLANMAAPGAPRLVGGCS
ncbi:MAG: hypothetical protein R2911_44435 [Caldilineaceae bacterium]